LLLPGFGDSTLRDREATNTTKVELVVKVVHA
jgi:hypothetical protein